MNFTEKINLAKTESSISKQADEMERYNKISRYVVTLLDNVNNPEEMSANDLYDIIYAKELIENVLSDGVSNPGVKKFIKGFP